MEVHIDDVSIAGSPERQMRRQRDRLLTASDWTQMPDSPLSDEQRAAWAVYRQALRDAPANWEPAATWDAPDLPG